MERYETSAWLADEYLTGRGIDRDTSEAFRLGVVHDPITGHEAYAGRLAIPSIGPRGNIYGLRFRSLDGQEPKYLGLPGVETRLFNLRAVAAGTEDIHITEGEIDAISLAVVGFQSVGVAGANAWKRHHQRLFSGYSHVYVWGDGDEAGRRFAASVAASLRNAKVVPVPEGQDCNSVLASQGRAGLRNLMEET